jgi:quercetin dioxygenase-like cupin family protein
MNEKDEVIIMTEQVRVRHMHLKSAEATPWHFHTQVVDNIYCLQGSLEVQLHAPDLQIPLVVGGRCEVLTGRVHRVVNLGQEQATYLLVRDQ